MGQLHAHYEMIRKLGIRDLPIQIDPLALVKVKSNTSKLFRFALQ
jgi:hypothetical protein